MSMVPFLFSDNKEVKLEFGGVKSDPVASKKTCDTRSKNTVVFLERAKRVEDAGQICSPATLLLYTVVQTQVQLLLC